MSKRATKTNILRWHEMTAEQRSAHAARMNAAQRPEDRARRLAAMRQRKADLRLERAAREAIA